MKVLIVGSCDDENLKERFETACFALGKALARGKHEIVLGSEQDRTADPHILEGYRSVDENTKVHVIRPDGGDAPFLDDKQIRYTRSSGSWSATRTLQINAADVVIVVGGHHATSQVGFSAPLLGVPVLAIRTFDGASKDIWSEFADDYKEILGELDGFDRLAETWEKGSADVVVQACTLLKAKNPYQAQSKAPLLLVLVAVLIGLWTYLFSQDPGYLPAIADLFVASAIGAIFGVLLRTLLQSKSSLPSAADLVIANIVTFAFLMLYFIGGVTISGDFEFISSIDFSAQQRILVSVTVIGLAAGFLNKKSIEFLEQRLGNTLNN